MNKKIFIQEIVDNIHREDIKGFVNRFVGYDFNEDNSELEEVINEIYMQIPKEELIKFEAELIKLTQCFNCDRKNHNSYDICGNCPFAL